MKKLWKVALATIIAALCVATLAMNVAGATPNGRSGLNYFAVPYDEHGLGFEMESTFQVIRGGESVFSLRQSVTYDRDDGGIENVPLEQQVQLRVGDIVRVYFHFPNNGIELFKYCNVNSSLNRYYASATLNASSISQTFYTGASNVVFYDGYANTITQGGGPYMLQSFNPNTLVQGIVFNYDIYNDYVVSEYSNVGCTLMQNNPIYTKYQTESEIANDKVSNLYVPYDPQWFADIYVVDGSYEDGFNEGYEQGVTDSNGEPLQRWGAFLVTAVGGFLDFEIYPGFPLWGLIAMAIAVPLMVAFLKMFAGG